MTVVLPALLVFVWVLVSASLLTGLRAQGKVRQRLGLAGYLGYALVQRQAREIGWNITAKEFLAIFVFAVIIGSVLAFVFKNPLIILAGFGCGIYLPRLLIQNYKKRQRMILMNSIPDFGRVLIARLTDHHSIVRAFETACSDISSPLGQMAGEFVKDTSAGIPVQPALESFKGKVGFRKFDTFAETLLLAHQEGYSQEALKAMEKAIEAIEGDIKAIQSLHISSRKKKRELLYVVLASWAFPVLLSFMNSNNVNIYLDTLYGKVLIFSFMISTLFVLVKGEEYLSLKLEEL